MNIHILSRAKVQYRRDAIWESTLLISIRDKGATQAAPWFRPDAALYLEFDDAGPQAEFPMLPDHATAVWKFLFDHAQPDKQLIVQCEVGISRSAAIGKAIEHFRGGDWSMFDRPPFYPNPHVFALMMEVAKAWEGQQEKLR